MFKFKNIFFNYKKSKNSLFSTKNNYLNLIIKNIKIILGPSLCRRARPQPLDLTCINDPTSSNGLDCNNTTINGGSTTSSSISSSTISQSSLSTSSAFNIHNTSNSSLLNLNAQMSQIASSPLLFNLQQNQNNQNSPLLSAAISALNNYAGGPSPLTAGFASPLAQAAAFQLASNLVATLSPNGE